MEEWPILYGLWERAHFATRNRSTPGVASSTWELEVRALYAMNVSIEAALHYLYQQRPSAEAFKVWLARCQMDTESMMSLHTTEDTQEEAVLSSDDLQFWERNGYVVIKEAVSKQQCADARQAIWDFLGAHPDNPASWYVVHEKQSGLMLQFSDHPALNLNRESRRIRKAYEQLYGTTEIYKTVDKVSFNPPETESFHFRGNGLHWDASLTLPMSDRFQGLLYLTDCGAEDGALHCVPGFHRTLESWLNSLPEGSNPRELAPQKLKAVPVPGQAGDFVIWHQALPHCATPNRGITPRLVQYLSYQNLNISEQKEWK